MFARSALVLVAVTAFGCSVEAGVPDEGSTQTNEAAAKPASCDLVKCAACAAGYEMSPTPGNCCRCVKSKGPDGSCTTPSDCDGLVHIMCVGSWSCVANQCSYTCTTTDPVTVQ